MIYLQTTKILRTRELLFTTKAVLEAKLKAKIDQKITAINTNDAQEKSIK